MIVIDPGCEPRELVRASGRPEAIGMIALPASRERVPRRGGCFSLLERLQTLSVDDLAHAMHSTERHMAHTDHGNSWGVQCGHTDVEQCS